MSIYKDNVTGKWRVVYRYTDWTGKTKQTSKRGFPTKREAQMWEHEQMLKHDAKLDMTFASFYEIYVEDKKERIRDNTWGTKNNIARTKILPYFGERKIAEIEPKDVIAWQNHLLAFKRANGKGYSASYLRKIHSQLSAIFNHAVDFYHLPSNPAQKAGNIAIEEYKEMLFWTKEEYLKFADVMMDKPVSYYAFEMLYWCGIREGELLALTPADFDFTTHTLRINKSYQRLNREDVITPPKTFKSNRFIKMPQFICDEMQDYMEMLYGLKEDERIFTISKSYLHHEMNRGSKVSGVKRIRVHDLRHSHVSLLINMGFTVLAIADRMGHESIDITYRYAHLFPSEQTQMQFICDEMQDYMGMLYGLKEDERIFTISKSYLHHEMNRGSKVSGVKRIRVHDLRHSHVSLLINMGFTVLAIADRMGHESIDITYRYAHLFPSEQTQMAEQLDIERMEKSNGEESGQ